MIRRNKPINRKTSMKRSRMKRKRRRGDSYGTRMAYLQLHSNCGVCHANWRQPLEVHHIVGAAGRKDVVENLLTLCRSCHDEYHRGERLTPGMLLTAKREQSPDCYDESVICELLGRKALPEKWQPKPLPQWAMEERERNLRK